MKRFLLLFALLLAWPSLSPGGEASPVLLTIAVAPFVTNKRPPREGQEFQHKVTSQLRAERRVRVVEVSRPVSIGPAADPDLAIGFKDAQSLLAESGADLLVWGTENAASFQGEDRWNIYVTANSQYQQAARSVGYDVNGTAYFTGMGQYDLPQVFNWLVMSWAGLLKQSEGMDTAGSIQEMVHKTDGMLSLAYEKHWGPYSILQLKKVLSVLLSFYGTKTHDVPSLERAIALNEEILKTESRREDPYDWACYENNLAADCSTLGQVENSPEVLQEACEAYRKELTVYTRKAYPTEWMGAQKDLANALVILGKREKGPGSLHEAIRRLDAALPEISSQVEAYDWIGLQGTLGNAYQALGEREKTTDSLRKSITHYELALSRPELKGMPVELARVETNLGSVYALLSTRTQEAKDYQETLAHIQKGVDLLRGFHSPHNLAVGLTNLAVNLQNYGRFKNDPALMAEARGTYQEAISLCVQSQDKMQWASLERNLGMLDLYTAEKTMDPAALQKSLDDFKDEQKVHDRKSSQLYWAQSRLMEGALEELMGMTSCDTRRMDQALMVLEGAREVLDPATQPLPCLQEDIYKGGILVHEGMAQGREAYYREGVASLEEASQAAQSTDFAPLITSAQSSLCFAYAEYLAHFSNAAVLEKAGKLLESLDPHFGSEPVEVDRANHLMNEAQLEWAVSNIRKDPQLLKSAFRHIQEARSLFQKGGYRYYEGQAQGVFGNVAASLSQGQQDPALAAQANEAYRKAEEILAPHGSCLLDDFKDGMRQVEARAPRN